MSRMLEALKQIESMRLRPQPSTYHSPADGQPETCVSARTFPEAESDTASAADDTWDAALTGLHPIIQEELDRLHPSPFLVPEPVSSPLTVHYAISDSLTIDETLARAESAIASVLQPEEPDIYEDMAQYILTQLPPGRPAALLFTSPRDGTGQSEMLSSLSKTLVNHRQGRVFVLDALPHDSMKQSGKTPGIGDGGDPALEDLKERYQLVLVDAPSLANIQTAAMISWCDGVYLVIRLGYTTPYDVCEALRVIQQAGGRLLGSIAIGDKL
jgi:hypothetical protein